MAQIIDRRTVAIPGPTGDVTPAAEAAQIAAEAARDEAEMWAAGTQALQDQAVAALVAGTGEARAALTDWRFGRGKHAVFIGDSITQGYQASSQSLRWSTLLCQQFGWVEHNYAVGGTGWKTQVSGDNRFDEQCAKAANSTTFDHADVAYVFLVGGVNDGAPDAAGWTAATTNATACVTAVKQAFPNAQIMAGVGISGVLDPDTHGQGATPIVQRLPFYAAIEAALSAAGAHVIPSMWRWIAAELAWQHSDRIHPNDAGYRRIADLMAQAVTGTLGDIRLTSAGTRMSPSGVVLSPGATVGAFVVNVVGDMLNITAQINRSLTAENSNGAIGTRKLTGFKLLDQLPPIFRTNKYAIVGGTIAAKGGVDAVQGSYLDIGQITGGSGLSALRANVKLLDGTAVFAEGDTVWAYMSLSLPLFGWWTS